MRDASVLIVSTAADIATDAVVVALSRRGIPHLRINTEDLPFERTMSLRYPGPDNAFAVSAGDGMPRTIWYRRMRSPSRPCSMEHGIYEFCLRENRAALLGGLLALESRWMSHPAAIWQAEFKPYQLRVAERIGLQIPPTIVSNDPDAIRRMFADLGPLIVKPANSGHLSIGDQEFAIYTTRLAEEHLEHLDEARLAPSIYQKLIPKRFDIRVTCVGDEQIFAVAIHSQTDPAAAVDWRQTSNPHLPHSRVDLPTELVERLRALMRQLHLKFGCIDLIQTLEDDYVFLEVNPSGQWLWLDDQLDLGISEAIASWLEGKNS